ncbi:hypothetical protein FQN60_015244 [Etheostoma spectabile]|uniref:SH2 domain-containing protein n=1 Tax=Etheostoma spectabile TaxID=54343 RepID=A0A5J5CTP4_9PERO|nr:hypothetical protein FQN60_015244 [Etheostoma spectabile]
MIDGDEITFAAEREDMDFCLTSEGQHGRKSLRTIDREDEELSEPDYDNDMYADPVEDQDDSYEPPPGHRVFSTTPSSSFPRGEYLVALFQLELRWSIEALYTVEPKPQCTGGVMQMLTPCFCFCFSFPDNCRNRPDRPPRKPLRPTKTSKQLPPEPTHRESNDEDYIHPDCNNDDDNYIEPEGNQSSSFYEVPDKESEYEEFSYYCPSDKPAEGPPPLLPKPLPRESSPKPPLKPRPALKPRKFEKFLFSSCPPPDGAFMVRKSSGQDVQQPYTLVVFYKGRVYNIPIRFIPTTQQYALGREKKGEEYFSSLSHIIDNHQKFPLMLIDSQSNTKEATRLCYPVRP